MISLKENITSYERLLWRFNIINSLRLKGRENEEENDGSILILSMNQKLI